MNFLMTLVNRDVTTVCFIICMFSLSAQQLCFVREIKKRWRLFIELFNGCMWLITAFACIILLYESWTAGKILYNNAFYMFTPLASFMYIIRVLASFIISGVSFDLASKDILKQK